MGKSIDLIGKTYGKLTVVSRADNKGRAPMWNCKCSCGNTKEVNGGSLRRGSTTSCGCNRMSASAKVKVASESGKTGNKHVVFIDDEYCALDDDMNIIKSYPFMSDAIRRRKNYVDNKPVEPVIEKPAEPVNYPGIKLKPNGKWSAILYIKGKGVSCGTHPTQAEALTAQTNKRESLGE